MVCERGRGRPWRRPAAPVRYAQQAPAKGPDAELVVDLFALVAELPSYGCRRMHALFRWKVHETGSTAPNQGVSTRVVNVNGLLLQRDGGQRDERRHDGRVAVDRRNARWRSAALDITFGKGEQVRVASAVDCCETAA